jgi:hypothetical protein
MPDPTPFETIPGLPDDVTSPIIEEAWFRNQQNQISDAMEQRAGTEKLISDPYWINWRNKLRERRASRYRRDTLEWEDVLKPNSGYNAEFKATIRDKFLRNRLDDGNIHWRSFVKDKKTRKFRYHIQDAMYDKGEEGSFLNFRLDDFPGAGDEMNYDGTRRVSGRIDYKKHQLFPDTVSLDNAFQTWNKIYTEPRLEQDIHKLVAAWNALASNNKELITITDSMIPERKDYPPEVLVKINRPNVPGSYDWVSIEELRNIEGNAMPSEQDLKDSIAGTVPGVRSPLIVEGFPPLGLDTTPTKPTEAMEGRQEARQLFRDDWIKAVGDNKRGPLNNESDINKSNFWLFRDKLQTALAVERLKSLSEEDLNDFNDFGEFIWQVSSEDEEGLKPFKLDPMRRTDWGREPKAVEAVQDVYNKQLALITKRSPRLMYKKGTTMEDVYRKRYANIMRQITNNLEEHGRFTSKTGPASLWEGSTPEEDWPQYYKPEDAYKLWDFYKEYNKGWDKYWGPQNYDARTRGPEAIDPDFNDENQEAMELFSQYMNIVAFMRKNKMRTASFSEDASSKYATYESRDKDGNTLKRAYTYPLAHAATVKKLDEIYDFAIRFADSDGNASFRFELGPKTWTEEGVAAKVTKTPQSRADKLKEKPKTTTSIPEGKPSSKAPLRKAVRAMGRSGK